MQWAGRMRRVTEMMKVKVMWLRGGSRGRGLRGRGLRRPRPRRPRPREPPLSHITFTFIISVTLLILPAHCMPAQP